jgi:hypothetical protein
MPEKGGRSTVSVVEVRRAPDVAGRRRWHFVLGHLEMVPSQSIEGVRDRVLDMVTPVRDLDPCVFVDVGTAQGLALRQSMRKVWPDDEIHRPHAYERTKFDNTMFANFLEVYADGRLTIRPEVGFRREMDRALVLYRATGAGTDDLLESEDEALVHAVSLSLMFPTHGADAADLLPPPPDEEA